MNNFLIVANLDIFPVLALLADPAQRWHAPQWKGVPERGERNDPNIGMGASLLLRSHKDISEANWLENLPVEDTAELKDWPAMRKLLWQAHGAIMANPMGPQFLNGEMARAMISRLDPGSTIFWHVDDGPYHANTIRFHVPLVTNPGCYLYSGPEVLHVQTGVLTYFNNHVRHCAANWGETFRLHLIFEMYRKEPAGGR